MDMINTKYQGQAEDLARSLEHEMAKRGRFQYNMTESIKKAHARTSLKRAVEFVNKMEVLIK